MIDTECQLSTHESLDGKDYIQYMMTVLKGRQDPIWWIKEYLGVKFSPHHTEQELILKQWYRHRYNPSMIPYKNMYILAGMRSGKTALDSMIACYELFNTVTLPKVPWEYYNLMRNQLVTLSVLSISRDQSDDGLWGNIQHFLDKNQWFDQWTDIRLRSESVDIPDKYVGVRVLSSSSTTIVGRSNIFVGLDELDSFENTEGKRGAWKVFTKMQNSTQTFGQDGRLCAISSSNDDPNSIMNTLIRQSEGKQNVLAIMRPTWVMNTAISEAELREEYKDNMAGFYRDFACMPGMYTGMEFPDGVKLAEIPNVLLTKRSPNNCARVLAIDPAAKNDAFGVATGYKLYGRVVVDGVYRFQKTGEDVFINPDDIDRFLEECYKYMNIRGLVFDTWMYPNIIHKAEQDHGIFCVKHIVRKAEYDAVKGMIKQGTLDVVADPILKREFEGLKIINDLRVDHPLQGSKDMADCVANVVWFLTEQEIEARKPRILLAKVF